MVRKVVSLISCTLALFIAFACTVQGATTHTIYQESTIDYTYLTYFKDIVSGIGFNDNYVAFRSGENSYTMIVGKLNYDNGVFTSAVSCKSYILSNNQYEVSEVTDFSINVNKSIVYSDIGDYPQLVERGAKYEIFTAILLCVIVLCIVINRIFYIRKC